MANVIPARTPVGDAGKDPLTGEIIPHERDEKTAGQVEAMAALGFSDREIASYLNLRPGQVREHYAKELEVAAVKANMQVAKAFFDVAKSGKNPQASQSWLKARAGWKFSDRLELAGDASAPLTVQVVRLGKDSNDGSDNP